MRASPTMASPGGLAIVVGFALACSASTAGAAWRRIAREHGVSVYVEPDDTRSVPRFKGEVIIDAPMYELLGVLADVARSSEWNNKISESVLIERLDDYRGRFYVRLDSPWPIDDRDAVLLAGVRSSRGGEELTATFHKVAGPERPVPSGVTRFRRLRGHFRLVRLAPRRTRVEYLVDADPSGLLPGWIVRYATKNMPLDALQGLRRQVRKTRGQYNDFVRRHDPRAGASTK